MMQRSVMSPTSPPFRSSEPAGGPGALREEDPAVVGTGTDAVVAEAQT